MKLPPRYLPIGVEAAGTRKVARVHNRATGDTNTFYERKNRILYFATDTPCRDAALRKLVREMLR